MQMEDFFELEKVVGKVEKYKFKRVGLQIPDNLLIQSFKIKLYLSHKCSKTEFIVISDTNFGSSGTEEDFRTSELSSCCLHEIPAKKYKCDLLVHFGYHCFSKTSKISSLIVPTLMPFDFETFAKECKIVFSTLKSSAPDSNILLIFDIRFKHISKDALSFLKDKLDLNIVEFDWIPLFHSTKENNNLLKSTCIEISGQIVSKSLLESCDILLYIGNEETELVRISFENSDKNFLNYNTNTKTIETIRLFDSLSEIVLKLPNRRYRRLLSSRLAYIEKAKKAKVFGILVNNAQLNNIVESIRSIKQLIKNFGKQSYSFFVDNINPQKLANFSNIDVFVILTCPNNVFIDSKSNEYFKPIISPSELEIALEVKDFSELSGNLLVDKIVLDKTKNSIMVSKVDATLSKAIGSSAAEFLKEQGYQGMDFKASSVPEKATTGQTGIASELRDLNDSSIKK